MKFRIGDNVIFVNKSEIIHNIYPLKKGEIYTVINRAVSDYNINRTNYISLSVYGDDIWYKEEDFEKFDEDIDEWDDITDELEF